MLLTDLCELCFCVQLAPEFENVQRHVLLDLAIASSFLSVSPLERICSAADISSGCFVVLRGEVSWSPDSKDANRDVLLSPGSCFEILSFLTGCAHCFSITATAESCIAHVPSDVLKKLLMEDETLIGMFSRPAVTNLGALLLAAQGLDLSDTHFSDRPDAIRQSSRAEQNGVAGTSTDETGKQNREEDGNIGDMLLINRRDALLQSRMAAFCGLETFSSTALQAAAKRSLASKLHALKLTSAVQLMASSRHSARKQFIANKLAAMGLTSHCLHKLCQFFYTEWLNAAIDLQSFLRRRLHHGPLTSDRNAITFLQARIRRNDLRVVAKMRALLVLRRNVLFKDVAIEAMESMVAASRAVRVRENKVNAFLLTLTRMM